METKQNKEVSRGERSENYRQRETVAPLVDIYENNDELLVVADLPGVVSEGLAIRVEKDQLSIEAHHDENQAQFTSQRDYARTFLVPSGIDAEKINAELKNGILTLHLPKSAKIKPRLIEVKTN